MRRLHCWITAVLGIMLMDFCLGCGEAPQPAETDENLENDPALQEEAPGPDA